MAILITKQDTDITTNEFYRVEAYQFGTFGNTLETLSTARQIAVTFANAGNCQGIVIALATGATQHLTGFRDVTVDLQELVLGVWTTRATKTLNTAQILTGTNPAGTWLVPFEFGTPYAVTTTAGVWRFNVYSAAGAATTHWSITKVNSGGTTADRYIYASWCDTQLTPVSGSDAIIFKNYCDITASFTFKGYLGIADSVRAFCAWSCRNLDPTPENVAFARVPSSISSLVTVKLDGLFVLSSHGGFRAGTSASPIGADLLDIQLTTPTVGTWRSEFTDANAFGSGGNLTARHSLFLYGVAPASRESVSTGSVAVGGTTVNVADPTPFAVDDFIMIGKRDNYVNADETGTPRHRITGISGNTLTFTPGLATYASRSGANVIRTYNNATGNAGYGIRVRRVGTIPVTAYPLISSTGLMSNVVCTGVFLELCYVLGSNNQGSVEDSAYNLGYRFTDCIMLNSTAMNSYGAGYSPFIQGGPMPISTVTFTRCIFTRSGIVGGFVYGNIVSGNPAVSYAGGSCNFYDVTIMRLPTNGVANGSLDNPNSAAIIQDNDGVFIDSVGAGRAGLFLSGVRGRWDNIEVYGANVGTGGNAGAVRVANLIEGSVKNLRINFSLVALNFEGINTNSTLSNVTFGDEYANTWDVASNGKAFTTSVFKGITGNPVIDTTTVANTATGSEIRFENVNAPNVDFVLQTFGDIYRTGAGLADTTVHTPGGSALRFRPKSSTQATYWQQDIPTGNIQDKTMTVGIWFKINSSSYWAGTHQMPRLTVTYDNGTASSYSEATQTTDWQYVQVAITPTTTFGQITFRVDGKTDATTTNADFYVDDFSAPLPQGSTLNLGGLDLFSNGLPVSPANFATTVTASDVWSADPTQFGAGTVGEVVNKTKKIVTGLQ